MAFHFFDVPPKTARVGGKQKQGVNLTAPVKRAYDGASKPIHPPANAELKPLPVVPVAPGQTPPPGIPHVGISRSKAIEIVQAHEIPEELLRQALAGEKLAGVTREGNRWFIPEDELNRWIDRTLQELAQAGRAEDE